MALWMEPGSIPQTESERIDLEAIAALKESTAIELKEEGNEYVKKGKKHYNEAIECYTKAINQNVLGDQETAILYSNRAHVNLLLGNNRRALEDAEQAIKLSPSNVKGYYRAAKAAFSLNLLGDVKSFCEKGIEISPDNKELKKLAKQVTVRLMEQERHKAEVSKALQSAQDLVSAFEIRGLKMGKLMYRELIGLKKPFLDESSILHWPVLLLYAEVMSSDFIEDFCETDIGEPLQWDKENAYTRDVVELYYEVGSEHPSSKAKILKHLLEGTPASGVENISEESESSSIHNFRGGGPSKFIKVDQRRTLHAVLQEKDYVIPGIPVFYVVSKRSRFYKEFKSGKWAPPALTVKEED
ncbi:hypothetical protein V2J09_005141 [Rumex salicifolius]